MPDNLKNSSQLTPVKQALIEIRELRSKISQMEKVKTEAIAIVGADVRFPGGANDLESFWQILRDEKDAITEIPKDRWNIDEYYDPDPDAPGKMSTKYGGFIKDVDKFDAELFGISDDEVMPMDPQHRLLLEVTWAALEYAGQAPDKLKGSNTGVFVGISTMDNFQRLISDKESINPHYAIGNCYSAAAGRISYVFGLKGPSVALDTACSSSLVAIHNACNALRNSECDMAIAGGVSLMLTPDLNINFSKARMMATDGHCKTFDKDADGYIRGEGCGVIILKRLSDAISDNNNILSVIKGSAVNHVGRSSGITAPNGPSQEMVITNALKNASVNPSDVSYVEAHGTGTTLGDPIEVQALASVFNKSHFNQDPLLIGTVKTNIGHLEAASGIAGIIKVILSMQHEQIPAHLNYKTPNPLINWNEIAVKVPTDITPWVKNERKRIAGVSSFGFSGTNAHIILEEAPSLNKEEDNNIERPLNIFTISAKKNESLIELATKYKTMFSTDDNPQLRFKDICYTANACRAHLESRLAILAESKQQAAQKLKEWKSGQNTSGIFENKESNIDTSKIAFLFSGEDSQFVQTGKSLYDTQPLFRKIINECADILKPYLDSPLLSVLYPENNSEDTNKNIYAKAILFSLEYALAQLWRSWGIEPTIVMGHGVGEIVAACIAGIISLEDGLKLSAGQQLDESFSFSQPKLDIISGISGQLEGKEMSRAEYWKEHAGNTIKISEGLEEMARQDYNIFLEISTRPLLIDKARQMFTNSKSICLTSLSPDKNDWQQILENLAVLYTYGVNVNWGNFDKDYNTKCVVLPTYPFQRQRYWIDIEEESISSKRETTSKKIDYKVLPRPNGSKNDRKANFVAPRNDSEEKIAAIWKEILNVEQIGIYDNFFDLGGQSVQTMYLSTEIERIFGKKLPLAALFPTPTIEKLAAALEQNEQQTSFHSLVPLQPKGSQTPLFGIHSTRFHTLSKYLGPDQPIYGIRYGHASMNSEDVLSLPDSIEDLAKSYIEEIQMIQPHGPYHLIGSCIGALVAFEMANQLVSKGEQLATLVLADPLIKGAEKPMSLKDKIINIRQVGPVEIVNRLQKKVIKSIRLAKGKKSNRAQFKYSDHLPKTVYPGKAIIIKTIGNVSLSSIFDPQLGWGELIAGGLDIYEVRSTHTGIFDEPAVQDLVEILKKYIEEKRTAQFYT